LVEGRGRSRLGRPVIGSDKMTMILFDILIHFIIGNMSPPQIGISKVLRGKGRDSPLKKRIVEPSRPLPGLLHHRQPV